MTVRDFSPVLGGVHRTVMMRLTCWGDNFWGGGKRETRLLEGGKMCFLGTGTLLFLFGSIAFFLKNKLQVNDLLHYVECVCKKCKQK